MPVRVLVVEDDAPVRHSVAETIREEGFDVVEATSAEHALSSLADTNPDIVLSDIRMAGMSGLELLAVLRERLPGVDVVIMTAFEDMPTIVRATREGAADFLVKPLKLDELRRVLRRIAEDREARQRVQRGVDQRSGDSSLDMIVGRDARMVDVYKRVGHVAAAGVSVLIRGETGTGKGLVARAIHANSPRAEEPFIAVNCTAIPETLLESELFGHVRGAFTGAVADRRGRFALAGRGTIFLDEVGDTSPEFQAKLLRVLEAREFFPVGADRAEHTEARVIAATHRHLEALVDDGKFREDLYYRLRIVEITLPALRERPDDIPLLATHFVRRAAADLDRAEPAIARDAMDVLVAHQWPGNVRELENCLTRAVVLAAAQVIRPEHLDLQHANTDASTKAFPRLESVEADLVGRALVVANGNRTRAAQLLGVSKPRLYRMILKYGLGR
jgi:DNA-binding NtrC family response regulator